MKYRAYFKEEQKVHTHKLSEIQNYISLGYKPNLENHTLTRPMKVKIFQIDDLNQIREANPKQFFKDFYNKEIIAKTDVDVLLKDLKNGKVCFDDIVYHSNKPE